MSPELSAFLTANGTALIIVVGALAAIGLVQWRKVRVAEQEGEYKRALVEKGVPVTEIERVTAKPPARRGLFDQFAGLSGGAKAGILIGAVCIFTVGMGCLTGIIAVLTHAGEHTSVAVQPPVELTPPSIAKSDAVPGNAYYLDLQPVANQKLTDVIGDNGHSLAALPQRRREFGGVPFQVGPGYIRLRGTQRPELPSEVTDIPVRMKFDKLHILHATEYGAFGAATHRFHVADGTEVGRYRVHYADEKEQIIPVVYGADVRDCWDWDSARPVSRGRVVWTGHSPAADREKVSLRLYLSAWANPRPDAEVESIDFVSAASTAATPFCLALTAERAVK